MEFIPISIHVTSNAHNPDGSYAKITFKKDCTEARFARCGNNYNNNHVQNFRTYCPEDTSKEQNLIFPQMFTDFFQVMFVATSHMFQNQVHLKLDGHGGDFLQYVFKSMVVPFTNLEKENNQLREQLQTNLKDTKEQLKEMDQAFLWLKEELKEKDQEEAQMKEQLSQMKEQLESKDQEMEQMKEQLAQMKKQLESKDQEIKISLLTASTLTSAIVSKDEELEEKDQYFEFMLQELKNTQEQLKDAKEEVKTRGLLLKSCVDDLKTYAEEVEEVEKKNQELEHLNHRLICETSSFVERNSYFSPEM